jgi:hypothetical protein
MTETMMGSTSAGDATTCDELCRIGVEGQFWGEDRNTGEETRFLARFGSAVGFGEEGSDDFCREDSLA